MTRIPTIVTKDTTLTRTRTRISITTHHRCVYDGEEDIESGPSRITIEDLERMDEKEQGQGYSITTSGTRSRERVQRIRNPSASTRRQRIRTITAASLLLLPLVNAAPPQHRSDTPSIPSPSRISHPFNLIPRQTNVVPSPSTSTTTSTSPSGSQTSQSYAASSIDGESTDYDIKYLTSMSTPTQALPTDVYVVDEQRLPFYMTQNANGDWIKVDNAWLLYGRQGGVCYHI